MVRIMFGQALFFVLSSVCEGMPVVLIEALAAGTPVVSTDCPGGPREVLQGGMVGRLVPVGYPKALSGAMKEALLQQPDHQGDKKLLFSRPEARNMLFLPRHRS